METEWVTVDEAAGRLEAEILRGMLESLGLRVRLSQESAAASYGLSLGPMARVEVMVPQEEASAAKAALDDYYSGREIPSDSGGEPTGD
ncbi:MAG TPA: DUF2007 domain-containing protein [Anaerolineales bacterium]|nr:DUF2007 domain-containing protein [Anaerolineales bacterium]